MVNSKLNNVLILCSHTRMTESLEPGGTISYLLEKNAKVYYAAFSTAKESVPAGLPKDISEN